VNRRGYSFFCGKHGLKPEQDSAVALHAEGCFANNLHDILTFFLDAADSVIVTEIRLPNRRKTTMLKELY
jgi:hypothetical protein